MKSAIFTILAVLLFSGTASAASITITNPSFESVTSDSNTAACTTGGTLNVGAYIDNTVATTGGCVDPTPAPGWVMAGDSAGVFRPTSANITSGVTGNNSAYSNGATITQTLASAAAAATYTLQVDIGKRLDTSFNGYTISLSAGSTVLGSHTSQVSPAAGTFATDTLSVIVPANSTAIGQALTVTLSSAGQQVDFDNVRLSSAPTVPALPTGGAAILALGLMVAAWFAFRRSPRTV